MQGAELNEAKVVLANAATALAHGEHAARSAADAARGVFADGTRDSGLPVMKLSRARLAQGLSLTDLLLEHAIQPPAARSAASPPAAACAWTARRSAIRTRRWRARSTGCA